MLKQAKRTFREVPVIRRWRRRASRMWKHMIGRPDAWADLLRVCRTINPAAILDVGSHIGRTVARFADEIRDVPIHAFEPTPASIAILRRNTARFRNVTVHELALADRAGTLPFHISRHAPANSLLNYSGGNGTVADDLHRLTEQLDRIEVQTTTLDEWCAVHAPVGDLVIKADVQGAEGLLLQGGAAAFANKRVAAFYSEIMFADIYEGQANFFDLHQRLTKDCGMFLWQIYELSRDSAGRAAWGDAMWVNEQGLAALR